MSFCRRREDDDLHTRWQDTVTTSLTKGMLKPQGRFTALSICKLSWNSSRPRQEIPHSDLMLDLMSRS